jgi:GT2 family glycosyltransferase
MFPQNNSGSVVLERIPQIRPLATEESVKIRTQKQSVTPAISVIILNYNGAAWLDRCLASLAAQTLASQIEVLVADNASTDGSDLLAVDLLRVRPDWRMIRHGKNLGYCGGNNKASRLARGSYLLFLNTDTWLEADCLERLLDEMRASGATAATPLVVDYVDNSMQSAGESGFDIFGLLSGPVTWSKQQEILVANGPSLFVDAGWFRKVGGFDAEFFMYADEYDLCWRMWLAGGKVILAPSARVHHRWAMGINACSGDRATEVETSDTKRFYANRNGLLVLLKNSQHLMLLMVPLQMMMLAAETLVTSLLTWRTSHFHRAYLDCILDCWRLRRHILAERRRLKGLRQRGDFWMLRFLRLRLNRMRELKRFLRFGVPNVSPQ